ncbi:MAG: hypothetical protein Q7U12_07515, partial [Undibacterium sp.]|nr:hypothetical protein [Undibacterium sp.]
HLLTLIAGDLMRQKATWLRISLAALLLALLLTAGVGVFALVKMPLKTLIECATSAEGCAELITVESIVSS